jgi:hypothetical protein
MTVHVRKDTGEVRVAKLRAYEPTISSPSANFTPRMTFGT